MNLLQARKRWGWWMSARRQCSCGLERDATSRLAVCLYPYLSVHHIRETVQIGSSSSTRSTALHNREKDPKTTTKLCGASKTRIKQSSHLSSPWWWSSYLDPVWRSRRKSTALLDVDELAMLLECVFQFFGGFKIGHRCWYFTSECRCFVFIHKCDGMKEDLVFTWPGADPNCWNGYNDCGSVRSTWAQQSSIRS